MKLKNFIPLIGLILLIAVVWSAGFRDILENILKINVFYLIPFFILLIIHVTIGGYKWKILFRNNKPQVISMIKLNLIGYFYGVITPAKLGYFYKIKYLKDIIKVPYTKGVPTVVVDRLMETISLLILALIGLFLLIRTQFFNLFYIYILIFLVIIILTFILLNKKWSKVFFKVFYKLFIPKRYKLFVKDGFHSFYSNIPKNKNVVICFFLTLLSWFLYFNLFYLIAMSLKIQMPYVNFILIYPFIVIASLIPITVAGFGTREASAVILFRLFGIEASKAVALTLLVFILTDLVLAVLGFLISIKWKERSQ